MTHRIPLKMFFPRHRLIDGGQRTASGRGGVGMFGGGGIEQKGKRTHGQQCGDCWGEEGIRGLNGNGKNI